MERNPLDNLGSLCMAGYVFVKFCRHHGIDPRKFIDHVETICFQREGDTGRPGALVESRRPHDGSATRRKSNKAR